MLYATMGLGNGNLEVILGFNDTEEEVEESARRHANNSTSDPVITWVVALGDESKLR